MRDIKPLMLPKLVAARHPSVDSPISDDRPFAYPESTLSTSECSTPLSQTFSTADHVRHSSSVSSLSSSPPSSHEHLDSMTSSSKLPRLPEDPMEGPYESPADDDEEREGRLGSWCLCSVTEGCPHSDSRTSHSTPCLPQSPAFEFSENPFGDDGESRYVPRRRRSGDSPASIASRVGERFPSLTRKWKDRKTPSSLSRETTRTSTPSGGRSSRASSTTGSVLPLSVNTSETELPQSPARLSAEHEDEPTPTSPVDIVRATLEADPIDRKALASTPLLPPLMCGKLSSAETAWQSPLQSPTVAESNATFSAMNSPLGTPQAPFVQTPPLSTKPSIASFRHGRPSPMVPSSDIPPMMINNEDDDQDEWAEKLGHANFTIEPRPYMPAVYDAAACRELFSNWEKARLNFTKHLVRTGEHFGVTSKTYKLTEQKWAEIDSLWKKSHDATVARVAEAGLDHPSCRTPSEPPPLMTLPALEDPKKPGQFPKLGDEDIVGPMVQAAARNLPHNRSSKKATWVKFFSDIKSPGTFFGVSAGSR